MIAVDASLQHVLLLRAAARRNGFADLRVVHGALTDSTGAVALVERGGHSRIAVPGERESTVGVPALTVDALLERHAWGTPDAIKIDIEGSEPAALAGMQRLHASSDRRPPIVFECNEPLLSRLGHSAASVRRRVSALGYDWLLIDHLRPGTLVEVDDPNHVQTEAATDYLALAAGRHAPPSGWSIEPPLSLETVLARLLDAAAFDHPDIRQAAAITLRDAPAWLSGHALGQPALRGLQLDEHAAVRAVANAAPRIARHPARRPRHDAQALLALAEHVDVHNAAPLPDRAVDAGDLVLRDVSIHLRRGEVLGVIAPPPAAGALLRLLAGIDTPVSGRLVTSPWAVLLCDIDELLDHNLTVAENITALAAARGADVLTAQPRIAELAELAGVGHLLGQTLADADPAGGAQVALVVALACGPGELILLDTSPAVIDPNVIRWAQHRIRERCAAGAGVVAVLGDGEPVGHPDRVCLTIDDQLVACGHPSSLVASQAGTAQSPAAGPSSSRHPRW